MTWHAIYRLSDGMRLSEGAVVLLSDAELSDMGRARKTFAERPANGSTWDSDTLTYVDPVIVKRMAPRDLLVRLTQTERTGILFDSDSDMKVKDLFFLLDKATMISLDDPHLLEGLNYLVTRGYLTQARLDEVLS